MKYLFIIFILLASCTDKKPIPEISTPLKLEENNLESSESPVSQEKIDEAFEKEKSQKENEDFPTLEDLQKETLSQLKKENNSLSMKSIDKKDNKSSFFIIVGSFKTNYFYEEMVKKINEEKLNFITNQFTKGDVVFKTIKVGPLSSKQEALSLLKELKSKGFPKDSFIK